jgi:hypothetical protein
LLRVSGGIKHLFFFGPPISIFVLNIDMISTFRYSSHSYQQTGKTVFPLDLCNPHNQTLGPEIST